MRYEDTCIDPEDGARCVTFEGGVRPTRELACVSLGLCVCRNNMDGLPIRRLIVYPSGDCEGEFLAVCAVVLDDAHVDALEKVDKGRT